MKKNYLKDININSYFKVDHGFSWNFIKDQNLTTKIEFRVD
jgi:hypothetical protein